MMDYSEAIAYFEETGKTGSVYGLDGMKRLMGELGNVQNRLRVIHVAGTNGKGSVCRILASVLKVAGYRVGCYSSPAVFDPLEIWSVDGQQVTEDAFAQAADAVIAACKKVTEKGGSHPTRFEMETALAFFWFYRQACDVVVLETGMGGTLDATNMVERPLCSVITSISRDHMQFLGGSLEEIAKAKAGIIKPGSPCVSAWQPPRVMEVLQAVAGQMRSPFWTVRPDALKEFACYAGGCSFRLQPELLLRAGAQSEGLGAMPETAGSGEGCAGGTVGPGLFLDSRVYQAGLSGAYQRENIACALGVLEIVALQLAGLSVQAVMQGLKQAVLPGRFEQIAKEPEFYLDGAHNTGAALFLRKTIENCFTNRKIIYIIGVLADKEYESVLHIMLPLADMVYTVTPENSRALDGAVLALAARKENVPAAYVKDMADAVQRAKKAAGPDGVVLAFGSLSFLGKIKSCVRG